MLIASPLGLSVSLFFLSIGLGKAVWIFAGLLFATDRTAARSGTALRLRDELWRGHA